MTVPIWQPTQQRIKEANITHYMSYLGSTFRTEVDDYESLYSWSLRNPERFWESIWQFGNVIGTFDPDNIVIHKDKMPGVRWFPEAQLNFAENLLKQKDDSIAIIERGEHGQRKSLTFRELHKQVGRLASSMQSMGIGKGDRVAGILPNISETIIAMLAATSLGAVWSSCSPDFGVQGVIDRFGQISPKLIFATNGYYYNGKPIRTMDRLNSIIKKLPGIEKVVIISYLREDKLNLSITNAISYNDFMDPNGGNLTYCPVSFNDPLYIMYSSGTTGVPKCIVHGVGGTLLQHLKELILHTDLKPQDRIFYYTTCGWMMWNWLVTSLSVGATIVLYDGSPFHPSPKALFDLIDEEEITIFGVSAKYITACEKAGLEPMKSHRLKFLKTILSTGSPLTHESFDYIYGKVKEDVCLSSISGGTDIISCFALGCPILPVYRGELQCTGLGMNVAFYSDEGDEIISEKGELVCKSPFPSMPTGFWKDTNHQKYHEAYFDRFEGVWAHGDYGEIVTHEKVDQRPYQRGVVIYGRSDATLNPGGVRIGTAEIYRQVEKIDSVIEALAIDQEWEGDTRIILFVRLIEGIHLTKSLIDSIKSLIRENTTPRHVPSRIIEVKDIPRTISGKIVELAVRNVVHNQPVKNKDALANPEALDYFRNIKELQS